MEGTSALAASRRCSSMPARPSLGDGDDRIGGAEIDADGETDASPSCGSRSLARLVNLQKHRTQAFTRCRSVRLTQSGFFRQLVEDICRRSVARFLMRDRDLGDQEQTPDNSFVTASPRRPDALASSSASTALGRLRRHESASRASMASISRALIMRSVTPSPGSRRSAGPFALQHRKPRGTAGRFKDAHRPRSALRRRSTPARRPALRAVLATKPVGMQLALTPRNTAGPASLRLQIERRGPDPSRAKRSPAAGGLRPRRRMSQQPQRSLLVTDSMNTDPAGFSFSDVGIHLGADQEPRPALFVRITDQTKPDCHRFSSIVIHRPLADRRTSRAFGSIMHGHAASLSHATSSNLPAVGLRRIPVVSVT